jgi:hypothetical protein
MARSLKPLGPGTARFSPCGHYRYELTRDLEGYPRPADQFPPRGVLVSIGLNPSTATCDDDDPTVHKESFYTIQWGYRLFIKTNAYGFRATVPDDMFAARDRGIDIVGPENDAAIRRAVELVRQQGGRVLVAWGKNIERERQAAISRLLADVDAYCIKPNKDGTPFHTCYSRNDAKPVLWRCPPS